MLQLIQALWDRMRDDYGRGAGVEIRDAYQRLLSGTLGPLTEHQQEDLESIERSMKKLIARFDGAPINWADYSEAAHALRGPLNSVIGFSRLMIKGLEGPTTAAQSEALETIYTHSRQMLTMFNLLLDLLLFYEQQIRFENRALSLREILDELVAVGQTLADNRGFTFRAQVKEPAAQATVLGDEKRLKQALSALLAVLGKYLDGGVLTLRAERAENGASIDLRSETCRLPASLPADLSHLLDGEADLDLPYDVHLRLALAWRLLTEMGSRMEAHQAGEVCAFTVTLPAF